MHPTRERIGGAVPYRSVLDLPEAPDAAFVAVRAEATVDVVRDLAAIGAGGAVCYAAGFGEAGRPELDEALRHAAGDLALLGPNCYGLIDFVDGVSAWPAPFPRERRARGVGLVLQSGNLGINVTLQQRGLDVGWVVTVGNQVGLDVAACVAALVEQPEVTGIGVYLEGLRDPAAFVAAAERALDRALPIVVVKAGASAAGASIAATHTSSLAGDDAAYDALFDRLGIARAPSLPALIETLKAMTTIGPVRGRRLAVLTCSGGDSALAADAASAAGLELVQPSAAATAAIAGALPPVREHREPPRLHDRALGPRAAAHDGLHAPRRRRARRRHARDRLPATLVRVRRGHHGRHQRRRCGCGHGRAAVRRRERAARGLAA